MKKLAAGLSVLAVLLCSATASAQFKSSVEPRPSVSESILRPDDGGGLLFGWFDPGKFDMHHSFSLSYMTAGGQGMSMGMYTNSMMYRFSDKLDVQADISLMASPFNTLGKQAQNNLSGLFLNRAEINYRPWKNTLLQLSFHQFPPGYAMTNGYGYGYGYGYGLGGSLFDSAIRTQESNR